MADYELIIYGGSGSVTYSRSTTSRVEALEVEMAENYAWKARFSLDNNEARASTENFLNSACAVWSSGTGAIALGSLVKVSLYPTSDPSTKTQILYGFVTSLKQEGQSLKVEVCNYLKRLEVQKPMKMIYSAYRDKYPLDHSEVESCNTIEGLDAGLHSPPVSVGFFNSDWVCQYADAWEHANYESAEALPTYDIAVQFMANAGTGTDLEWANRPADADLAEFIGVYRILFAVHAIDAGVHSFDLQVGIQGDDDGEPDGTYIGSGTYSYPTPGGTEDVLMLNGNQPCIIRKGVKYWVVWHITAIDRDSASDHVHLNGYNGNYTLEGSNGYWYSFGGWTQKTGKMIDFALDFTQLIDMSFDDVVYDATNNRYTLLRNSGEKNDVATTYWDSFYRGVVSYFYNTVTAQTIMETLIGLDSSLTASVSSDCGTTWAMYRLKGKSILDGLRDVADVVDDSGGTFNGRQYGFQHYWNGSTNYIIVGYRYNLSDSALFSFAHRIDTTEALARIISVSLKQVSEERPSAVMVIGQGSNGEPLAVFRTDEAKSGSFRTSSKLPTTVVINDRELKTTQMCSDRAYAVLDKYARGSWEGSILVDGIYPDVFNLTNTPYAFGSGGIVSLTYTPIGITSATKFKVTSVVVNVFKNTSEIHLNNYDILIENSIKATKQTTERFEQVTPEDMEASLFFPCYDDAHPAIATYFIGLIDSGGSVLGDRIQATYFANSSYNAEHYTAVFPPGESTTSGGAKVAKVRLYSLETGGTYYAEYVLTSAEQFEKFSTQTLIIDLMTKAS